MNFFENFLYMLQETMIEPTRFGWFHLMWIGITIVSIMILFKFRSKYSEKQLKLILGIYGVIAFLLEITKQLIWSFNYDAILNISTWNYEWYAAPFQLCTTPIYVSIICLFLSKNKLRDSLLSYLAFYTILGSISTMLIPDSCFTSDILVNIHTMYLHLGSFVVSIYLLISNEIKINYSNLLKGFLVFLIFAFLANTMNITFYKIGIIGDATFNMFYISPYFNSILPVFDKIQESIPYIFFLLIYLIAIFLGGNLIYLISYFIKDVKNKFNIN